MVLGVTQICTEDTSCDRASNAKPSRLIRGLLWWRSTYLLLRKPTSRLSFQLSHGFENSADLKGKENPTITRTLFILTFAPELYLAQRKSLSLEGNSILFHFSCRHRSRGPAIIDGINVWTQVAQRKDRPPAIVSTGLQPPPLETAGM